LSLAGKEKDIAGLIISGIVTPKFLRIVKKSKIPYVLIGDVYQKAKTGEDVDVIACNDFEGVYMATKHLIDLGHKRILYFTKYLEKHSWNIKQLEGYKEAHRKAGIICDKDLQLETGSIQSNSGYITMKEFLEKSIHSASAQDGESFDKPPSTSLRTSRMVSKAEPRKVEPIPFTALICDRNTLAIGIIKALGEKGLRIPEDVSIVVSGRLPDLTIVTVDFEKIGRAAVERLLDRLTNPDWQPKRVVVSNKLIVRNSTMRLRGKQIKELFQLGGSNNV
jgi:DNA-binding LacI/PurR family transcriptional regulator